MFYIEHRNGIDGRSDDEIGETPELIKIKCAKCIKKHTSRLGFSAIFSKPINNTFQALFKENCQFSRQKENSSTF